MEMDQLCKNTVQLRSTGMSYGEIAKHLKYGTNSLHEHLKKCKLYQ